MNKGVKYGMYGLLLILVGAGSTYMVRLLDWAMNVFFPTADGWLKYAIPIGIIVIMIAAIAFIVGIVALGMKLWK